MSEYDQQQQMNSTLNVSYLQGLTSSFANTQLLSQKSQKSVSKDIDKKVLINEKEIKKFKNAQDIMAKQASAHKMQNQAKKSRSPTPDVIYLTMDECKSEAETILRNRVETKKKISESTASTVVPPLKISASDKLG